MSAHCQDSSDGANIASFSLIWLGYVLQCCTEIAWRCERVDQVFFFFFPAFTSHFVFFLTHPRRESGWAQISSHVPDGHTDNTQCAFFLVCLRSFIYCLILFPQVHSVTRIKHCIWTFLQATDTFTCLPVSKATKHIGQLFYQVHMTCLEPDFMSGGWRMFKLFYPHSI